MELDEWVELVDESVEPEVDETDVDWEDVPAIVKVSKTISGKCVLYWQPLLMPVVLARRVKW